VVRRLLQELSARGIEVDAVAGQLRVRAPAGAIGAELRGRLQASRGELVSLLENRPHPLTGPQRQLWFVDRVEGSGGLQLQLRLRLSGALERERLERAIERLVERHEALRTRIEVQGGSPWQVVSGERSEWFVVALEQVGDWEHELRLQVHHLACDGWSMAVLLEDLGRLYSGAVLPELPIRLRDVARELDLRERSAEFEGRLGAWVARLGDVGPIDLPVDRRRPERPSSAGASVERVIEPERWGAAVAYARDRGATPFMLVAAAVVVVLGRWTRAGSSICLGVPHANRGRSELAGVVAMLVDTLLLRVDVEPGESLAFDAVLERTREAVLAMLEHADLPLDRVVALLPRTRSRALAGVALPNVMLNYAGFEPPRPEFEGLGCEVEASMPGSRFDLTIYAYPRGGRLELEAAFRSELFEPGTMAALLEQVAGVIEGNAVAAEFELRSSEPGEVLPIASTIASWPGERTAIVATQGSTSYAGLRSEADRIARTLAPGERVAIFATRSAATIVALLAVLRAGASFVILDSTHPDARLIEMIELTKPSTWLALDSPPPTEVAQALQAHAHAHVVGTPAEAYVAFTSGTTGRPRAVIGTLEPLEHFFAWYRGALAIDESDRFAWLSGLGHDPTLRDIFGALCVGAQIHVPPRAPVEMGAALGEWLAAHEITVVHWTPSLARMLAATLARPLPALRRVCFGGDALRGDDVRVWRRLAPNAELFNFYGTTETPQAIAVHRITEADAERPFVPIGRGIEGVTLCVESPTGPVAIGEIGEIVVHGRYLARGYLGEPELGPYYRTGDLGRRRHDGSVVCLGRLDDQIQIRGERVELGEVESVLSELASTRVAVCARETDDGERELIAWLTGGTPASTHALREAAAARLPRALLPTRWAAIAELPLTSNAKLDRRALAQLEIEAHELAPGDDEPEGALERAIAPIWAELLGRDHVGRHDDFFACGGHSLLAVRLAVRIHEALGVELPIWSLFERPTLAGCAAAIERHHIAELPELRKRDHGPHPPASFAQVHLWLLDQLADAASQPTIVHSLRLRDALDELALAWALVELEHRHEVLRTTFLLVDDRLCTHINPVRARVLEHGPPTQSRFDLERGPVWRAHLWTTDSGERRLELELHHICGEADSMRILVRDLLDLYEAAREDRASDLPELACRYVDVAAWQRESSETPLAREALSRWQTRLAGVEPLELPRAPNTRSPTRGIWLERELEAPLAQGIDRLAARESTTSFAILLCALAAVLARWSGRSDPTIGAPIGMRPHPATRELVGPFLDLVALRLDASGDPSLAELLARTRASVREAFADSLVPFERILQALYAEPRERTLEHTPVFQVLLNMVDVGETERLWARLGAERVIEREPIPRHELAVYAVRRSNGMHLALLYDAARYEPEQGHALLEHLRASLLELLERPQQRLSELPLRRPDTDHPPPPTPPRHELPYSRFVAIARTHPQAVAIDMGPHATTYAQLHAHVLALADRLRGLTRVGLLVREDEHMAAGMLAALALGVTYVPLDPRLPPARLHELIADAEPDALLCTASLTALATSLAQGRPILPLECPPEPTATPTLPTETDGIAYLLYTSGSTGRPKAVMQSRANLLHHALTYAERLALGPGDRVSLVATHAFDAAIMDIYGALLSGATLCPIDLHGDALVDLDAELRTRAITIFHATPTVVRHLLATRTTTSRLESVRAVVLGGEEAHAADAHAIAACFGHPTDTALGSTVRIINGLGPTECTLALQELVDEPPPPGSLAVGAPVPGVRVSLETPIGEQPALYGIGEIVLDSPHVALGYWRADVDERAFSQHGGRRRYRTGDLGRWLPGGRIGFVGRRGGFVKLRGHRIEPGEIEARLRSLPGVRAAAIVLRESELLGFYVTDPDAPGETQLLRALATELPKPMVPARLLRLEALPRTPTGKLDRRALEQLSLPLGVAAPPDPLGDSEAKILAIWTHVLGHPPPRVDLDWFACGGDSLGAARLVRACARQLGLTVSLAEMFEGTTIAGLARRLDGHDEVAPTRVARIRQLANGSGAPWLCVLPPGSHANLLEPLAARLGRSIWSIEPPSFGEVGPLPTIDVIIDAIARALEHPGLCTQDDYVLAGISNGGLLAFELLATLPASWARPRALLLFDSPTPELLASRPWSQRSEASLRAAFAEAQALSRVHVREHDLPLDDHGLLAAMFARYRDHGERVWQVLHRLDVRGRIDTPVVLIEARDGAMQLAARWRALQPNSSAHTVPGDHLQIFAEQHVDTLVSVLLGRFC
jgi:amino acid adenylation domain-containing protein